jgi:hypothetical protein
MIRKGSFMSEMTMGMRRSPQWIATLAVLIIVSIDCSGGSPHPAAEDAAVQPPDSDQIPDADRPPDSLRRLGQSAMELFDAAWASDWTWAADRLQGLHGAESDLPADLPTPDLVPQLHSRVATASNAANNRQRVETMDAANAITQLVAELSAEYPCTVPYQVKLLGYYARQIEVGIASERMPTIARASTDLEATWNQVQPVIEQFGQIAAARRLADLVADVIGASRPADVDRPARAILVAVDNLETAFAGRTGEPCSEAAHQ